MDYMPTRKVTGAGIGAPVAIVVVWAVGAYGLEMPAEVGAALGSIISTVIAYATREATI